MARAVPILLAFWLVVPVAGCMALSQAQRDSDEEEWGAKWGSDSPSGRDAPAPDRPPGPPAEEPPPPPPPLEPPRRPTRPEETAPAPAPEESETVGVGGLALEEPPEAPEAPTAEPVAPEPARPQATPAARPVEPAPPRAAPPRRDGQPDWLFEARGGIVILRGPRVEPLVGLGAGWNLGRLLGWPGLFLRLDLDTVIGQTPLGTGYVQFDALAGFLGRFRLGPVALRADLGFGVRGMAVTQRSPSAEESPELGYGARFGLGLEVPLLDWLSVLLAGDGRYMLDPITGRFQIGSAISGGVAFAI